MSVDGSNDNNDNSSISNNSISNALLAFSRLKPLDRSEALKNILGVVDNLLQFPDATKYRRIRTSNEVFIRRGGRFPETQLYLEYIGFRESSDGFLSIETLNEPVLQLARRELNETILSLQNACLEEEMGNKEGSISLMNTLRDIRKRKIDEDCMKREAILAKASASANKDNASFQQQHPRGDLGMVGLINQGATCYLNACLQMLYHLWPIRQAIYSLNDDQQISGDSVLLATQQLFTELQLSPFEVSTRDFTKNAFHWHGREARLHQDVHEFFERFSVQLTEAAEGTRIAGFLDRLLKGRVQSTIRCADVDYVSKTEEEFSDLRLDVRYDSIEASLTALLTPELLDGENAVDCPGHGKQAAYKSWSFQQLPCVLMLQLMRFEFDPSSFKMKKLNDRCTFPEELDVERLLLPQERSGSAYQLFGILVHMGGVQAGHYVAYLRPEIQQQQQPLWYKFNDAVVSKVSKQDAADAHFGGGVPGSPTAYILLYIRVPIQQGLCEPQVPLPVKTLYDLQALEREQRQQKEKEEANCMRLYVYSNAALFKTRPNHAATLLRWDQAQVITVDGECSLRKAMAAFSSENKLWACSSVTGGEIEDGWKHFGASALDKPLSRFAPRVRYLRLFVHDGPKNAGEVLLLFRQVSGDGQGLDYLGCVVARATMTVREAAIMAGSRWGHDDAAMKAWVEGGERVHCNWSIAENKLKSGQVILLSSSVVDAADLMKHLRATVLVTFVSSSSVNDIAVRLPKKMTMHQATESIGGIMLVLSAPQVVRSNIVKRNSCWRVLGPNGMKKTLGALMAVADANAEALIIRYANMDHESMIGQLGGTFVERQQHEDEKGQMHYQWKHWKGSVCALTNDTVSSAFARGFPADSCSVRVFSRNVNGFDAEITQAAAKLWVSNEWSDLVVLVEKTTNTLSSLLIWQSTIPSSFDLVYIPTVISIIINNSNNSGGDTTVQSDDHDDIPESFSPFFTIIVPSCSLLQQCIVCSDSFGNPSLQSYSVQLVASNGAATSSAEADHSNFNVESYLHHSGMQQKSPYLQLMATKN